MKLTAVAALLGGLAAVPLTGTAVPIAAATPSSYCDGAGCVPYVNHDAALGGGCTQDTRYNFGMDASGNTLACSGKQQWVSSPPLAGVRPLRSPCGKDTRVAQTPDGIPLACKGGAWSQDFTVMFYG